MIEISYLSERGKMEALHIMVQKAVKNILQVLDSEYGANRDKYNDNGDYVIIVERKEDFKEITDKTYINCDTVIVEYVDTIVCSDGEVYTNSLILCNNDYAISLIITMELTPQNFKNYIIE